VVIQIKISFERPIVGALFLFHGLFLAGQLNYPTPCIPHTWGKFKRTGDTPETPAGENSPALLFQNIPNNYPIRYYTDRKTR
jgi:hypothetical protein